MGRGSSQPAVDNEGQSSVAAWRLERLVSSGFDQELAARIAADPGFDLHVVLELVDRGCPPRLAWRIAAPLEEEP